MFVMYTRPTGRKSYYPSLYSNSWDKTTKSSQCRYFAYLGRNPATRLKQLIAEGKLTKEEAAKISFKTHYDLPGEEELIELLKQLKQELQAHNMAKRGVN